MDAVTHYSIDYQMDNTHIHRLSREANVRIGGGAVLTVEMDVKPSIPPTL